MGTTALVSVVGDVRLLERALCRIRELEAMWSRFQPGSDVVRLRAANGEPVAVAPETIRLVQAAVAAWELTAGRCDPTVLDAMVQNGYDRDFAALDKARRHCAPRQATHGCADIEIDPELSIIRLPVGVGIDPGGIGKGLAADMVVEQLLRDGARGALVDIGGDIRVDGVGPADGGWVVDVESPFTEAPLAHLRLSSGAVATSSCLRRRWGPDLETHHIIDPATGLPTQTSVAAATVFAPAGWIAEALAKAVVVAGTVEVVGDSPVIAVHYDGRVVTSNVAVTT